ncbi:tRNA preQ1(34) S-adenosylmethionine ribosyltransferase-isomerase QueA [Helicobacter sp. 16-1353]|uniref:tRNA preQ1(34) S-adenosylmethionine ribosyltransferase-isomerase QueA n=1 Tax=Helicobacter sp. 16-1353 TaxID=2004996 RepID=UPI000DCF4BA2|nr:tRNA preQ1(34) S-adenosylmethionine ribosyltransferase-isomerase QueA [Helicobacter sp. 16-1353]RAX51507.1 tRNA preQ1(34) S-adenosylmethionine ribosyltransferase-isomerase QueA [Helicobacter sp. 16-1353]
MNQTKLDVKSLQSYDYDLPKELIATYPIYPKNQAKLLVYDRSDDSITHSYFKDFFDFIPKNCLFVLNDTKVLKARIFGKKSSGGSVEILYHNALDNHRFIVQIKGKVKVGDEIIFPSSLKAIILECLRDGTRIIEFSKNGEILNKQDIVGILNEIGHIPLPPYIKREDCLSDESDYQSVFAKNIGAIAAPTASLHFDNNDLEKIKQKEHCFITLHIGAGTFFGVESQNITNHKMHKESFFIDNTAKMKIDNAKKILCIGTTTCRCVEYYAKSGKTKGDCDIFINPLNPPIKTNYLLTNFHLPKSSLIMLVSAFIGVEKTLEIYNIAKNAQYRFYSYGDGMLIL